ncbi:hypothetical protein E4U25_003159 [Claviceps purpurea]|nr:hypothetical protein E4U11_005861 [Claviceps purpurea]KAG6174559.1 hypothetical protein E4U51_001570 [Claviceps purpurea]KAG6236965.1 hypothetical protein E4U25_003159 [Claviceps purpurea]
MKSAVVALSLVAAVAAQDLSALAQCGQICANNMMTAAKAEELGCKMNDIKCLCSNVNFMYGLRDCSHAVCNQQDANQVVAFGVKVCESMGGVVVTGGNAGPSQSGANGQGGAHVTTIHTVVTGTDGQVMTIPVATSTIEGGSDGAHSGSAHTTTIYSTLTGSDGKVITTAVATSVIEGGNAGATGSMDAGASTMTTMMSQPSAPTGTESADASAVPSATGGEATATDGSGSGSGAGAGSGSGSGSGSQTSAGGPSSATSTSSTGFAAHITAAPGLLAAAGLAALLI